MHPKILQKGLTAFAFLLFACVAGSVAQAAEARLNVLFLFADDMRADTVSALGNPNLQTPNLDRLVRGGLAFNRAYMQGAMNGATCVPSRAMLLSGRPVFRIDEKLMRDETWPAAFGKAGYSTFMTGKWHNGAPSVAKSFQVAHSVFLGGMTNPLTAKLSTLEDGKMGTPVTPPKHGCAVFAEEAIQFISQKHDSPFFCYVPFFAPHDPHIVPPDFSIRYDADKIPLPKNFLPQHPFRNGEMAVRDEQLLPWPRTEKDVKQILADYYRYVTYLDSQIGRILDALEASPYRDNTLIVFSADSGVARGSHGLIGKQNLYEHSIRVPLIIKGPGVAKGKTTEAMCYLYDVLPTVAKRCGVTGLTTSEGVDFSPVLEDPQSSARKQMVFAYRGVQRAIRDDRWKLITYPKINRTQLFDLQADPLETKDLGAAPENAARVAEMTGLMAKELAAIGDQQPLKSDSPEPAEWTPPRRNAKPKEGKEEAEATPALAAERKTVQMQGWTVHLSPRLLAEQKEATDKALQLLEKQLGEIIRVVPEKAVTELRKVPLWFSPDYPGIQPRAEYHPGAAWLAANDRDPVMAKGVEFTNVRIFEAETRRMPNFALHELAHAYHDRFLTFEEPRIVAAFQKAKASGKYEKVKRRNSEGVERIDRAYAMTNHKEYFAECTEAFFSTNDFFPFTKDELKEYDPEMFEVLEAIWGKK